VLLRRQSNHFICPVDRGQVEKVTEFLLYAAMAATAAAAAFLIAVAWAVFTLLWIDARGDVPMRLRHKLLLFECIGYAVVGLALYGAYALVRDVL
jgi:hypothetical protein